MITATQRFCISLGCLNIVLSPRISLQGISKVYSWKQKVPECKIWKWWNVTSLGEKSDLTFDCNWDDHRRAWNIVYKLSSIETSILDSLISIIWLLNVSMRSINKETRLFFGENRLSGDFVFQKEQITLWWKCHTFLVIFTWFETLKTLSFYAQRTGKFFGEYYLFDHYDRLYFDDEIFSVIDSNRFV